MLRMHRSHARLGEHIQAIFSQQSAGIILILDSHQGGSLFCYTYQHWRPQNINNLNNNDLTMKLPQYLTFKLDSTTIKPPTTDVNQLSPIPLTMSPLMQQYQKKMQKFLLTDTPGLSFEHLETPGWSSLVETDKPSTKRTQVATREEILRKITQQPQQREPLRQKSPKYSNQNNVRLHSTSSYAKLKAPAPGMNMASQLTERSKELKSSKTNRSSYQSAKKLPKKEGDSSRFKQISVHDHLYLDSKRQQAKKMMQKLVDEEFKKNILSFQPKISTYTQLLAQNRFKRMNQDPDYRCSRKKVQNRKSTAKVQDPTEVEYRHLHFFFSQITGGNQVLSRSTLSVDNIPLPCLRSIQPLLEQVFMGMNLTWTNFLDLFYTKALNRKAFFQLLKQKQKRHYRQATNKSVNILEQQQNQVKY